MIKWTVQFKARKLLFETKVKRKWSTNRREMGVSVALSPGDARKEPNSTWAVELTSAATLSTDRCSSYSAAARAPLSLCPFHLPPPKPTDPPTSHLSNPQFSRQLVPFLRAASATANAVKIESPSLHTRTHQVFFWE